MVAGPIADLRSVFATALLKDIAQQGDGTSKTLPRLQKCGTMQTQPPVRVDLYISTMWHHRVTLGTVLLPGRCCDGWTGRQAKRLLAMRAHMLSTRHSYWWVAALAVIRLAHGH